MDQAAPGRRRRIHSAEFKAQAVRASQQPGVSMAAVAMAHGINANLLRRWVHEMTRPPIDAAAASANPVGFHAYLFANRRATRMKVLVHDGIGVWLAARRLH